MLAPGGTIGIIGGGQLGAMFAAAARRMGYRLWTLDPDPEAPCAAAADGHITAPFGDTRALDRLAAETDLVTYEFENIPAAAVEYLERAGRPVFPGSLALRTAQDRLLEKEFLRAAGIPAAPYAEVRDEAGLRTAVAAVGFPAVLKTARGGYDGKGQCVVRDPASAEAAFRRLLRAGGALVLEKFVRFEKELSVICARNAAGETAVFPAAENAHRDGILHLSTVPAGITPAAEAALAAIARSLAQRLSLAGTLCVEAFLLPDGALLVNELAPRPHNSGHYTLDACETSQFEQHLRAVCGLPLGSTRLRSPAAMVNILGTGEGDVLTGAEEALKESSVKLHLYGKREARAGRKMGHLTALGGSAAAACRRALAARAKLAWSPTGRSAAGTARKIAAHGEI
ncbi:MAG: 5-(carboxyamino)imidazole ribonucleotide synthase [Elusimicrobiota bacterium]